MAEKPTLQRRHVVAVIAGNALEFYDFVTYAFFSIQIGHAFFPSRTAYGSLMLSLATFGAGFLTRPLGVIVIGAYADRAGRRPAMMLCFTLMGCAIVGMALIPPYTSIGLAAPILAILARMTQGFSLGGEVGSNTAYLAEAAAPERRGLVISWQAVAQTVAIVTGSLVGLAVTTWLPAAWVDAYAWRVAFLVGTITVPFGLWLRSGIPETLHLPETVTVPVPVPDAPLSPTALGQVRRHWRVFVFGMGYIASGTIASYVFTYIVTYAQATLHLPSRVGFVTEMGGYFCSVPVILGSAWLSDRIGRWPVNVYGNLAFLVLIYPVFSWVTSSHSELAFITGMIGLNVLSCISAFYASLAESLPKSIRVRGFGITYSLAIAFFGGTTQLIITWLIHVSGNPVAPAWYLLGAAAIGQVSLMLFPESAPVKLAARQRAAAVATA